MSIKGGQYGQLFIDMKTEIISYGPHNGIIIHCGLQQEPNLFWPGVSSPASYFLVPEQFHVTPKLNAIHKAIIEDSGDNQRNKDTPSGRCLFNDKDMASSLDSFNIPEKNLSMVEMKPFHVTSRSNKSCLSTKIPRIPTDEIPHAKNSVRATPIIDYHRTAGKASNEKMRKEHMVRCSSNGQNASIAPVDSILTPTKQFLNKPPTNYMKFSGQLAKYDSNENEEEFLADPSSTAGLPVMAGGQKMNCELMNCVTEHCQKGNDHMFCASLANLPEHHHPVHQRQQCISPHSFHVQRNQRKVPEQVYHLYETQDAFGNLLQQVEMEIDVKERVVPEVSSLDFLKGNLETNNDGKAKNLTENPGQSLLSVDFTRKLKGNERLPIYLQHNCKPSTGTFNDANFLRHSSYSVDSQSVPSERPAPLIPTSSEEAHESIFLSKAYEIKMSGDINKNIPENTASEYFEALTPMSSPTNSQQLQVIAKNRTDSQDIMEKEVNFGNTSEGSRIRDAVADSVPSIVTAPVKSILYLSSEKRRLRKKVQFLVGGPRVIALEHRLLFDDFHSV